TFFRRLKLFEKKQTNQQNIKTPKFEFLRYKGKRSQEKHMEYVLRIMATPKGVAVLEKIINPEK
ncbi:hypothetical protein ACQ1Q6_01840, partial [Ornithobacterium rhinotracheale]